MIPVRLDDECLIGLMICTVLALIYWTSVARSRSSGLVTEEHCVCRWFVLLPCPHTQSHLTLWCLCAFLNEEILIPGWDIALSWGNQALCWSGPAHHGGLGPWGRGKVERTSLLVLTQVQNYLFFPKENGILNGVHTTVVGELSTCLWYTSRSYKNPELSRTIWAQ